MKKVSVTLKTLLVIAASALVGAGAGTVNATEPCGGFGECKVLVEINATDGDIGFHFLMDGHDLIRAAIYAPNHRKIFYDSARGPLREQFLTETFAESAEPLCWEPEEGDEEFGEDVVTLEEFLDRWQEGTYTFIGIGDGWEFSFGQTTLTFDLPAAPDIAFDVNTSVISWSPGDDLGECSDGLDELIADGKLPDPEMVEVVAWEAVFEPDVEDGDPLGAQKFIVRVSADTHAVTVPADYLASLPDDTLVKIEVGGIGAGDNATFTEIFDICVNETEEGCEEEEEEEEGD
ncbi:MAG: hypothetical protein IIA07_11475 [Proteobacteria bacterium]|nr:hypothetical protein [Pseudomonadota bacterium]